MGSPLGSRSISRRVALLAAALLVVAAAWATRPAAGSSEDTVRLIVDYGDGASKTVANLPWAKGNTILGAMKAATTGRTEFRSAIPDQATRPSLPRSMTCRIRAAAPARRTGDIGATALMVIAALPYSSCKPRTPSSGDSQRNKGNSVDALNLAQLYAPFSRSVDRSAHDRITRRA